MVATMTDAAMTPAPLSPLGVDELVTKHFHLVGYLVRSSSVRLPGHVHPDDLTSAAMAALVRSATRFAPDRGIPFERYVTTRIQGALTDELRRLDWASRGA